MYMHVCMTVSYSVTWYMCIVYVCAIYVRCVCLCLRVYDMACVYIP